MIRDLFHPLLVFPFDDDFTFFVILFIIFLLLSSLCVSSVFVRPPSSLLSLSLSCCSFPLDILLLLFHSSLFLFSSFSCCSPFVLVSSLLATTSFPFSVLSRIDLASSPHLCFALLRYRSIASSYPKYVRYGCSSDVKVFSDDSVNNMCGSHGMTLVKPTALGRRE